MASPESALQMRFRILNLARQPRPSKHSLLGLPRELRDSIWSLALTDPPLLERAIRGRMSRVVRVRAYTRHSSDIVENAECSIVVAWVEAKLLARARDVLVAQIETFFQRFKDGDAFRGQG